MINLQNRKFCIEFKKSKKTEGETDHDKEI